MHRDDLRLCSVTRKKWTRSQHSSGVAQFFSSGEIGEGEGAGGWADDALAGRATEDVFMEAPVFTRARRYTPRPVTPLGRPLGDQRSCTRRRLLCLLLALWHSSVLLGTFCAVGRCVLILSGCLRTRPLRAAADRAQDFPARHARHSAIACTCDVRAARHRSLAWRPASWKESLPRRSGC